MSGGGDITISSEKVNLMRMSEGIAVCEVAFMTRDRSAVKEASEIPGN